jgi:hypothetical protein
MGFVWYDGSGLYGREDVVMDSEGEIEISPWIKIPTYTRHLVGLSVLVEVKSL